MAGFQTRYHRDYERIVWALRERSKPTWIANLRNLIGQNFKCEFRMILTEGDTEGDADRSDTAKNHATLTSTRKSGPTLLWNRRS